MQTINIKNGYLESLIKVMNYNLPFQQGRVKNRFLSIITEKAQAVEKSRIEMIKELCKKDDKGEPLIEKGNYSFDDENMKKFQGEYTKLMEEDAVIDATPSVMSDIGTVKVIINNSTVVLDGRETFIVDEILKSFDVKPVEEVKVKKTK